MPEEAGKLRYQQKVKLMPYLEDLIWMLIRNLHSTNLQKRLSQLMCTSLIYT